jgi:hypothetical protein
MRGSYAVEEDVSMGYGNPIFDGDEPLPAQDSRQRMVSMRLWRSGLLARTSDEEMSLPDRHADEDRGGAATERQRHQGHDKGREST